MSKVCTKRKACEVCGRLHPTPFHGDFNREQRNGSANIKPSDDSSEPANVDSASCFMSGQGEEQVNSLIVPVWLSHNDDPRQKIMVYTLLMISPIRRSLRRKHFVSLVCEATRLSSCYLRCMGRTQPYPVRKSMAYSFKILSAKSRFLYLTHSRRRQFQLGESKFPNLKLP